MDIGAISGVGRILPVQAEAAARDLSGVFRVEFQREQQDSYSPREQQADRGLEDEDDGYGAQEDGDASPGVVGWSGSAENAGQLSFFA